MSVLCVPCPSLRSGALCAECLDHSDRTSLVSRCRIVGGHASSLKMYVFPRADEVILSSAVARYLLNQPQFLQFVEGFPRRGRCQASKLHGFGPAKHTLIIVLIKQEQYFFSSRCRGDNLSDQAFKRCFMIVQHRFVQYERCFFAVRCLFPSLRRNFLPSVASPV